ncbi:MAG: diacylglycerol kinase family protein [Bacillota bacterium]
MFVKLRRSFFFAIAGIMYALKSQRNMKIHFLALLFVTVAGIWLGLSPLEWSIIIMMAGLVLIMELLNTSMEALVDLKTQEYHQLAKTAKDVAAGAVLIASVVSVIVGMLILGPKILMRLWG